MDNFDPYNIFLAIATYIPVLLMTGFVVQDHIYTKSCYVLLCLKTAILTFFTIDMIQEIYGIFYYTITDIAVVPERKEMHIISTEIAQNPEILSANEKTLDNIHCVSTIHKKTKH